MAKTKPLRLLVFDDTCRRDWVVAGLTHSWIAGWYFYRGLGRLDYARGVRSWGEALLWLATVERERPIGEIQFWGHGKWGQARVDGEVLDLSVLDAGHRYRNLLDDIQRRLVGPQALWWFRTCETFGARSGHQFAREWTSFFNCRAASHTYIIGPWQSGLHCLEPGEVPNWSLEEGLEEGTAERPEKALWSRPGEPNTITCLHNRHRELRK